MIRPALPRDLCARIAAFVGPACSAEQHALREALGWWWRIRLQCALFLAHPAFGRHWQRLVRGRRFRLQRLDLWLNAPDVRPDWARLWRRFAGVNEVVVRISNGADAGNVAWLWASMLRAPPVALTLILHAEESAAPGLGTLVHRVETFRLRYAGPSIGSLRWAPLPGGAPQHIDLAVPAHSLAAGWLSHTPVLSLRFGPPLSGRRRITIPADSRVQWLHLYNVRCRSHLPVLLLPRLCLCTVDIHDAACLQDAADFRAIADGARTVRVHFRVPHVDEWVCRGFADVVLAGLAGHGDHTLLLRAATGKPECVAWLAEVAREHVRRNRGARLVA